MRRSFPTNLIATVLLMAALAACGTGANTATNSPAPALPPPVVDVSRVAAADPGSALAEGWQHGAFMEIFVRGYKDSDGDGIGDLNGVTQSLDYLRDLGIKGIWLMPITKSDDHDHGYATNDYRAIEPAYGTLADFDTLIKEAHARGIGVVMDYVINHSGYKNALFLNSAHARDNPYRDWYLWQDVAPSGWAIFGNNPWYSTSTGAYFGQFSRTMPDFNFRNAAVIDYHHHNLRFWLNRGLDGFRFDAVTHLVENGMNATQDQAENYPIMAAVGRLTNGYAKRFNVCEATSNAPAYAAADVCGSAFAFGHSENIVKAAKGDTNAIRAVASYFNSAPQRMSTMVSNHDLFAGERLWDQVGGDTNQYRLAAATYLLQPGSPFIYYGEEIGMAAGTGLSGDPKLRVPMSWTADAKGFTSGTPFRPLATNVARQNVAAQVGDADSLHAFYKALLGLRNTRASLARGSYEAASVNGSAMSFVRNFEGEKTLVVMNYGTRPATFTLEGITAAQKLTRVYGRRVSTLTRVGAKIEASLAPQSLAIYAVVSP